MEDDLVRERRIALLLADGSGDFDFVHASCFHDLLILRGHVFSEEAKERAERIARGAGFTTVLNELRVRRPMSHPPVKNPPPANPG